MTVTPDAPVTATAPPVSSRPVIVRLLRDPQGALCLLWLAFVGFLAVSAPWLAPTSPTATDLAATNAPPQRVRGSPFFALLHAPLPRLLS